MKARILLFTMLAVVALSACRRQPTRTLQQKEKVENRVGDDLEGTAEDIVIDFTMADIDGKNRSIEVEAALHKLTIIDFWASWCGPCRQEMPRLVHLYNMYKDSGLGIIGVSLDEDAESWKAAVSSMNMGWLQLSDLQGWDNAAAVEYGIRSIPFTIIVDGKAKVLAAGLRGEQLAQFVEQHLDK